MTPRTLQAVLRTLAHAGHPVSDAELLRRVRSADEAAFTELVRRHGRLVWAACRHLTRCSASRRRCQTARETHLPPPACPRYHRPSHCPAAPFQGIPVFRKTDTAYDTMTPAQAAEAVDVLDLHARWEALRDTPAADPHAVAGRLRELQNAFHAYRTRMTEFVTRYTGGRVPELSPAGPGRLAIWCRAVAVVVGRSGVTGCPAGVVAKAHRMAARIAGRIGVEPPVPDEGVAGEAGRELDPVLRWCEELIAAGLKPVTVR